MCWCEGGTEGLLVCSSAVQSPEFPIAARHKCTWTWLLCRALQIIPYYFTWKQTSHIGSISAQGCTWFSMVLHLELLHGGT